MTFLSGFDEVSEYILNRISGRDKEVKMIVNSCPSEMAADFVEHSVPNLIIRYNKFRVIGSRKMFNKINQIFKSKVHQKGFCCF